jgi:glutamate-1-semialdehyde 2,1-aminomutase
MQTRAAGRTGIQLSVIGFGTAQLQMLPERQAVAALVRAFELGVNWVHTAPDYGGIDPWIARAIEQSGRDIMVLSAGPARLQDLGPFFENTCHVYRTDRLALYGLSGIEDLEWSGENVWGRGGMIEYLQARKAEGRLGGIYCSTHASADYVARLVDSGVFDAIMLAWNPLGFHQQSHPSARKKAGRDYENLTEYRDRIFPLAAARGVSVLAMKPFAGGLLCRGKAFPPHDWFASPGEPVSAADVLRLVLEEPSVCAVVPGTASPEEAEENARAGHAPLFITTERRARVARAVNSMRASLCSRCGDCETTCTHHLDIPSMFRDAYIWTSRNETVMANPAENYFDLHPQAVLTCATCTDRSCLCPQGIDIPNALARVHVGMLGLRGETQHPGPTAMQHQRTVAAAHRVILHTIDVPARVSAGAPSVARFLVENAGAELWLAPQHTPDASAALGIGVVLNDRLAATIPLRNSVHPGERSPIVFEFDAPPEPDRYALRFCLMPFTARDAGTATTIYSGTLAVTPATEIGSGSQPESGWPPPPAYAATYLDHTIPEQMHAGDTCGVRVTIENIGTATWRAHAPEGEIVDVVVVVDGTVQSVLPLPQPEVTPGGTVTLHFSLVAPEVPGRREVRLELLHRGRASFAHDGVDPLRACVRVDGAPATETARLFAIARNHNPWHYLPTNGIGASRDGHAFPLFVSRAKGCRFWDADGREFLDYTMGWGSSLLGHAPDRIQQAIRDVLDCGAVPAFPHPAEMDVTRMLVEDWPSAEMVVFGKNGSDVCTIAARLARVTTGKRIILSCGFHGWQDFALDYFSFAESGIPDRPERTLHKFTFNDRAGFLALYDRCKDDLAAIMIEPAGALINEQAGLGGDADPEFLNLLADAAKRVNALLIFDEIITGYRYPAGSVQKTTGVVPDLTCLGKALAAGMPLSALVGSSRIFLNGFARTHYCPTFKAEIYSLAAARAAIQIYRSEPVAEHVWQYGEALRRGIDEACSQAGLAGACTGPPYRMAFVFHDADQERWRLKRTLLVQELLKERIVTVSGMLLPSYAHDARTLAATIAGFGRALEIVAHADRTGALHRYIEIPVL